MITTTTVHNDVPSVYIKILKPGHEIHSVDIPATRVMGEIILKTVFATLYRIYANH